MRKVLCVGALMLTLGLCACNDKDNKKHEEGPATVLFLSGDNESLPMYEGKSMFLLDNGGECYEVYVKGNSFLKGELTKEAYDFAPSVRGSGVYYRVDKEAWFLGEELVPINLGEGEVIGLTVDDSYVLIQDGESLRLVSAKDGAIRYEIKSSGGYLDSYGKWMLYKKDDKFYKIAISADMTSDDEKLCEEEGLVTLLGSSDCFRVIANCSGTQFLYTKADGTYIYSMDDKKTYKLSDMRVNFVPKEYRYDLLGVSCGIGSFEKEAVRVSDDYYRVASGELIVMDEWNVEHQVYMADGSTDVVYRDRFGAYYLSEYGKSDKLILNAGCGVISFAPDRELKDYVYVNSDHELIHRTEVVAEGVSDVFYSSEYGLYVGICSDGKVFSYDGAEVKELGFEVKDMYLLDPVSPIMRPYDPDPEYKVIRSDALIVVRNGEEYEVMKWSE